METTFKKKAMLLAVLSVGMMFIASFALPTHPGLANAQQNKTLMQPHGVQSTTTTNASKMNIILVHGAWADASSWSKVIPILQKAGHRVIAVQLPEHSLVVMMSLL
jgi:pimeloyl-ACP methyl ester carboxylesterase